MKTKKKTVQLPLLPRVTETDLLEIRILREEADILSAKLKKLNALIGQYESDVVAQLKAGAEVVGKLGAVVATEEGRCSPKWKDELLVHMLQSHGIAPELTTATVQARWPGKLVEKLVITDKK